MTDRGWWLLITGTGRCGTGYLSQVLTSVGVKCSHEGMFQPDPPEVTVEKIRIRLENGWWGWEAESSWLAAPFLGRPELKDITVVHLVRDPKKVIDSQMRIHAFWDSDNKFRKWQLLWVPEITTLLSPFEQAAHFYVRWNRMIEPFADIRWRVEDGVLGLLDRLGIDWHDTEVYSNTHYNSRTGWGPSDVDLDGLPKPIRGELREMGERYGYEWPGA